MTDKNGMTVGELKEELEQYDDDLPILFYMDTWPNTQVKSVEKGSTSDARIDEEHVLLL